MTERERVEEVRLFFRFKKKEFAELLGHAYPQNYSNYLNGKSNLSIKMLKAIKEYNSSINTDWVLYGQGEMFMNNETSNSQKIINGDANNAQIGDNNKNTINSDNSNIKEFEYLKKEIEHLKQRLEDKEELITMLKKNQK